MKLENQIIPVSDVDRAKGFYERLGWRLDDDVAPLDGLRIVQFTPPGSGTSVTFGLGLTTAAPGAAEGGLVVSDIDRAKEFYEQLGWRFDDDVAPLDGLRIVQFTPPGSGASITFGRGLTTAAPGSAGGGIVVSDIEAAHDELAGRGIDVSNVWHGPPFPVEARQPGPDPERTSYGSFCSFTDPDGNLWLVQEVTTRLPGRVD